MPGIRARKGGKPIAMVTAYDFPSAAAAEEAGVDILLVGDSVANVVLGLERTLEVSMEMMVHHVRAVARARREALLVADMPFLSFQGRPEEALQNAGRLLQAGADAVKLEGGHEVAETVAFLVERGVPVMAHIGLTPQKVHRFGGYRAQGKDLESARRLMEEAHRLEEAGAFAIVLESIPAVLARVITRNLQIPTIGIGAGPDCDGQVLVFHDLLGWNYGHIPRFVRRYANLREIIADALKKYVEDVRAGRFPGEEETYVRADYTEAQLLS